MKMRFSSTQFYELINDLMTACHQVHQEHIDIELNFEEFNLLVKDKLQIIESMK